MSQPRVRVGVLIPQDDQILLVRHRKGDKTYWMLPGGGLDAGETFAVCAEREVHEETGLQIKTERMLYISEAICPRGTRHVVNVFMLARLEGGTVSLPENDVIEEVAFHPVSALSEITLYPAIAPEIIAAHRNGYQGEIRYLGSLWAD
jgi:ADP-ribose pyrophosphatase YjhB (NUDIX family)